MHLPLSRPARFGIPRGRRLMSSFPSWIDRRRMRLMLHVPALVWSLLSSLLLWMSFFPFDLGVLGWVALIPLMPVLEAYLEPTATKPRWFDRPLLSAWLGGLAFCLVAFQWIRLASEPMYAAWGVRSVVRVVCEWACFVLL